MSLWMTPAELSCWFAVLASCLDVRNQARFLTLLGGVLFARGRRTVTSWLRAAGIADDFRPAYSLLWTVGRRTAWMAARLLRCGAAASGGRAVASVVRPGRHAHRALRPVRAGGRRPPQPDAGAGRAEVRLRPRLGHAGLAGATPAVGEHRPAAAGNLYVRAKDVPKLPPEYQLALPHQTGVGRGVAALAGGVAEALGRAAVAGHRRGLRQPRVLRAARRDQVTVVSRLRRDAALCDLPGPRPAGRRGRPPIYGRHRIDLAKRAGQRRGWRTETFDLYGRHGDRELQDVPGDLAAGRGRDPSGAGAGGAGRGRRSSAPTRRRPWRTCSTAVADRASIEQAFHDLKEVWGGGSSSCGTCGPTSGRSTSACGCTRLVGVVGLGPAAGEVDRPHGRRRGTTRPVGRRTRIGGGRCSGNPCVRNIAPLGPAGAKHENIGAWRIAYSA